ncbi:MAG: hypothetical protein C0403_19830 [Desulfobacterium sp.]|nr:hypothetical protein [Desulfobacterium sp.]
MTFSLKKLLQALDQYDAMQSQHLQAISDSGNQNPDLRVLNFQRSRTFEDLKNQLRFHIKTWNTDNDNLENKECRSRLEKIICKEKCIASLTAEYRQKLIHQKRQMQQGKKALRGYGGACISGSP